MMFRRVCLAVALMAAAAGAASAGPVMPDFSTVPVGWVTDRYDPASFLNVGTFQGRDNVLAIGIDRADGATARPPAFSSMFYNTQGKQYAFGSVQGAGSVLSADLWIPDAWSNPANGAARSDVWGVLSDGASVTGYPIIGFTNDGGARYRYWTDAGWTNLATPVAYNAWTSFSLAFDGTQIDYLINGVNVGSFTFTGSTGFSATIMQAYNFFDPANFPNTVAENYTAYWSNTPAVPEPTMLGLVGLGLVAVARRLRR